MKIIFQGKSELRVAFERSTFSQIRLRFYAIFHDDVLQYLKKKPQSRLLFSSLVLSSSQESVAPTAPWHTPESQI